MTKLSPQKTIIVEALRDKQWHCGSEWLNKIKDDRIRITELNRGYMLERGWKIVGEPCRGKICGCCTSRKNRRKIMRQAQKLNPKGIIPTEAPKNAPKRTVGSNTDMLAWFDSIPV